MSLVPCSTCRRHVRAGASVCPFCSNALPGDPRALPAASSRMGRSALFAFATTVAACGAQTETGTGGADTSVATDSTAASDTATSDTSMVEDTGTLMGAYGGPPPDTGVKDTGGPVPLYGAAPIDSGTD